MADVRITARKNGPYRVEAPEGSLELMDADGTKYDRRSRGQKRIRTGVQTRHKIVPPLGASFVGISWTLPEGAHVRPAISGTAALIPGASPRLFAFTLVCWGPFSVNRNHDEPTSGMALFSQIACFAPLGSLRNIS
jgi:hypothetical protein